eukprot:2964950-Prymnesium_polylepis.1
MGSSQRAASGTHSHAHGESQRGVRFAHGGVVLERETRRALQGPPSAWCVSRGGLGGRRRADRVGARMSAECVIACHSAHLDSKARVAASARAELQAESVRLRLEFARRLRLDGHRERLPRREAQ